MDATEEESGADDRLEEALRPLLDLANRSPSTPSTVDFVHPTPALLKYQSPRQKRARLGRVSTTSTTDEMLLQSKSPAPKSQRWLSLTPTRSVGDETMGGTPRTPGVNSKDSTGKARLSLDQTLEKTPSPSARPAKTDSAVKLQRTNSKESPRKVTEGAAPSQPLKLLKGFELVNILGKSGERTVIQAKTPQQEQVVVKCIEKCRFLMRPGPSLRQEAELMKELEHPGIVRLLNCVEDDNQLCLVMEYVPGGDMFHDIAQQGRFSEAQAARLLRQLADTLSYVHSKNIVHRDLKPENLLLSCTDRDVMQVKIGDFGISRQTLSSEDCQTYSGSRDYRAPEVIRASFGNSKPSAQAQCKGYGKAADMWSLGVVLFVMLSAERAFDTYDAVNREIMLGSPVTRLNDDCWKPISEEAKDLMRSLMQQDPKVRLTAEQVKMHAWLK